MRKTTFIASCGWMLGCMVMIFSACGGKQTAQSADTDSLWLIVGSYAAAEDDGIKAYAFSQADGGAEEASALSGISNPSFLVPSSDAAFLYAVGEDGGNSSTVNAISFDAATGEMKLLDTRLTMGGSPCYVSLSPDERFVLTANYMGASISVVQRAEDGLFASDAFVIPFQGKGVHPERQTQPHLHCVAFTPDGKRLLANDLGLDCIHLYNVNADAQDAKSLLKHSGDIKVAAESGPRHVVFSSDGQKAYLINEISGTVNVFAVDSTLNELQTIAADTVGAQGSGDIRLSPDGKFLYASNRLQADGLAIFSVGDDGLLTRIAYQLTGLHPRNFAITPNGRYLLVACRDDNSIEIYQRDLATGLLTLSSTISTSKPVCLQFVRK